ncbi:TolC family protein [Pseudomonas orientalis]|uniref:TolC family protein n=1 Tax=Pseudomonas orientalis TaxID=76758 RepID=UPI002FE37C8F
MLPVPQTLQGETSTGTPSSVTGEVEGLSEEERQLLAGLDSSAQLPHRVEQALNYNRDLRLALLRVEQARAQYGISRADRMPTVALGLQRNRQHLHDKAADERYGQDIAVASVGVSDFELDFFGRVRNLSEAAQHDYLATRYGALAARKALIVEGARLYLQERLQEGVQSDTQSILDNQNLLLSVLDVQQKEGLVAQDTVDTRRMEVRRAAQQWQDASADHARAQHISRKGPNGAWIVRRGPNHPDAQALANRHAYYLGSPGSPETLVHRDHNKIWSTEILELFSTHEEAKEFAAMLDEGNETPDTAIGRAEGLDLLSLFALVDAVEIGSHQLAITRAGANYFEHDKATMSEIVAALPLAINPVLVPST